METNAPRSITEPVMFETQDLPRQMMQRANDEIESLRQRVAELEKEQDELVKALEFIARMRWGRDSEKVTLNALAKLGTDKTGEKCGPVAVVHEELECDPYGTTGTGRLTIVPIKAMGKSGLRKNDLLYLHPTPNVEQDAKRYRWLRENWTHITSEVSLNNIKFTVNSDCWGVLGEDAIDAAIDAAMQEKQP